MNKSGVIIAIIVVLALAGGAFALTRDADEPETTTTNTTTTETETTPETGDTTTDQQSAGTITYTNDGFEPGSVTVAAGSTVTVKNDSSRILQFNSNPHPVHTDNDDLNVGTISPGQSETFTVSETGTFGFHNHLNESHTGTLIVE